MMSPHAGSSLRTAAAALALSASTTAEATWSICLADCETKEVAVGTVTCLNNFDLLAIVPVVVVGKGSAAVQASGDFDGIRRPIIFAELMNGTDPEEILEILSGIAGHQNRQYGITDTQCRMITFSGQFNLQWAGGVIGQVGTMVYAIQGNILAGDCVVPAIENAILTTPGDIPEKLMAGMEAARATGGDGRCSCSLGNRTGCGCPPPNFEKSGHIGGMIVARIGDTDDDVCNANGCADGDYFMRLNVPFQNSGNPDPVFQLQQMFDDWRQNLLGRPDAIQSDVSFDPPCIMPDGVSTTTMTVQLRDWRGFTTSVPILSFTVEHAPESDGTSTIGPVNALGGGLFEIEITAGTGVGVDRFRIVAEDDKRPVTLMPDPTLVFSNLLDFDVEFGSHLAGDLCDLVGSDDKRLSTRSSFGLTAFEPNLMEMIVGAASDAAVPEQIDITIESRLNNPNGTARARLKNWNTNLFEEVAQFNVGTVEETVEILGVDATDRVRAADGRMELSLRYSVIATFSLLGFDAFFDLVGVDAQ